MGLVEKLTELDESIWKQHEKVTRYCNREYGWNKYDLVRKTLFATTASYLGEMTYMALGGIDEDRSYPIVIGGFFSLLTIVSYPLLMKSINEKEEREIKLLERTGATIEPVFKATRPAYSSALGALCAYMAYFSFTKQLGLPEDVSEQYHQTTGLFFSAGFIWNIFRTSKSYFEDQIMTPPKKKKSVLKTIYEKVIRKFQVAPVPQLEPVKPIKYQSIDDAVA